MTVSIAGIPKGKVLAALYNRSCPQGMGFLQATTGDMTEAEADRILAGATRFDYLRGRVLKVDLSGDEFRESLYDRDLGQGAAQIAIDGIAQPTNHPRAPQAGAE